MLTKNQDPLMKSRHHGCIPWLSKEALTKSRYEKIGFPYEPVQAITKTGCPL